ncbi:MAG: deoxyribose-phosphate aldolase [Bosea sp. (in: a-proteobacteria)]
MTADAQKTAARRAIRLLDLTDLSDGASEAGTLQLCAKAKHHGDVPAVAAICIWPQFVGIARRALAGTGIKVATVANFPAGGTNVVRISGDIAEALDDGADEIDLVFPWQTFLAGDEALASDMISEARGICEGITLKVILETGQYPDQASIAAAARLAVAVGADFLKTSTGKSPISATPDAARTLLGVIKAAGRPVGLKVSGGIRSLGDAQTYLAFADEMMGPDWAMPSTFRIGASSLHGTLADVIAGTNAGERSDGAY